MSYLRLKEAFARSRAETARAAISEEAVNRFTASHVGPIVDALSRALADGSARYLWLVARALTRKAGPAPRSSAPVTPIIWPDDDRCGCSPLGDTGV